MGKKGAGISGQGKARAGRTGPGMFLGPVLALLLLLLTAVPAQSQKPGIERIILSDADEQLVVYFRLKDAFLNPEINRLVQAGIRTVITYKAELLLVRAVLPAQSLAQAELVRALVYDPLSGRYRVSTRGREEPAVTTTTNLVLAQYLMTEVADLRICPMDLLGKGQTYRVRLRAVLHKPEIPKNFKYKILIAPRDIVTDWYEVEIER